MPCEPRRSSTSSPSSTRRRISHARRDNDRLAPGHQLLDAEQLLRSPSPRATRPRNRSTQPRSSIRPPCLRRLSARRRGRRGMHGHSPRKRHLRQSFPLSHPQNTRAPPRVRARTFFAPRQGASSSGDSGAPPQPRLPSLGFSAFMAAGARAIHGNFAPPTFSTLSSHRPGSPRPSSSPRRRRPLALEYRRLATSSRRSTTRRESPFVDRCLAGGSRARAPSDVSE